MAIFNEHLLDVLDDFAARAMAARTVASARVRAARWPYVDAAPAA